MEMGLRLRERREARRLKNSQVATYLNISTAHVSDIENGKSNPSLDLLARLARYYDTSSDYLLGITDDPRPYAQRGLPPQGERLLTILATLSEDRQLELLGHAQVILDAQQRAENAAQLSEMLDQVQAIGGDDAMSALLDILEVADTDEAAAVAMLNRFIANRVSGRRRRPNGAQKGSDQAKPASLA